MNSEGEHLQWLERRARALVDIVRLERGTVVERREVTMQDAQELFNSGQGWRWGSHHPKRTP
jgi:hypothetical protein